MSVKTINIVTLEELCARLLISQATARNWVKSGKLKPVKVSTRPGRLGKLCFDKADVDELVRTLESGGGDRLTRRRNKTKHTGNVVPAGYVARRDYTETARRIIAEFDALGGGEPMMRLILAEYSMKLLAGKGLIAPGKGIMAERWLADPGFLGSYRPLIDDLMDKTTTRQEVLRAAPALREELSYIENEDFLGLLYMSISSMAKRKTEGVYYTPKRIAEDCVFYLDRQGDLAGKRILDPCCGTGNFLMNVFAAIAAHMPLVDGEHLIKNHLFAADIDPLSICLARVNLTLTARLNNPAVLYQNLRVTDSLFDFENDSFDVILSNPPWGSAYDEGYKQRIRERFANSGPVHIESFAVFLLKAIQMVAQGGIVCYVLPQSFLNVMAHDRLRELVAKDCDVLRVKYWRNIFDKVYAPTITVTVRKGHGGGGYIEVENGGLPYRIDASRLGRPGVFNFSVGDREHELLEKLDAAPGAVRLKDHADFALGIVTGDNQSFLKPRRYRGMEPVLRGTDIRAYTYETPKRFLSFSPERFQQVAPEQYYRAPEKLIYKFVSASLCFAYDNRQTLSLNSCNILIPRFDTLPIKYILAVLNSSAAHFYFTNKFQSVKVLRSHIEDIPIPQVDEATLAKMCALVDELLAAKEERLRYALIQTLDNAVMDLFCLTVEERALIRTEASRRPAVEKDRTTEKDE